MNNKITDDIIYIGVNDKELDLFESQYVVPNGVSYNSYIIMDEKIAVMDTADVRATDEWFANLTEALGDRTPDYLVISHMEPDHSANIRRLAKAYPQMKLVGNTKTFQMLGQFFEDFDTTDRQVVVKEGDTLSLGSHELTFILTPMVHWPEVMMTFDKKDGVFFAADAFGKFGTLDTDEDWACEARRYYFNIVGKYGSMVQLALKKAAAFDIKTICPLHGPILTENLEYYLNKYNVWSSYEPEDKGIVVACASIHGNTKKAALKLVDTLQAKGEKVTFFDLTRDDDAEAIEDAFRYDRLVVAASTYDGGLFPCMEEFLNHLAARSYQKRTVGIIENGTWAPQAAKRMKAVIETMKDVTILEPVVTIKSALNSESEAKLNELAAALV